MKKPFFYIIFLPIDILLLTVGILFFKIRGVTPKISFNSMLRLFYISGGISNDFISFFTKKKINHYKKSINSNLADKINEDGLFIFDNFLNENELLEVKKIVENYKFKLRKTDQQLNNKLIKEQYHFFDPNNPKAVLYEVDSNYLINQKIIQKIITKKDIYEICSYYFKAEPVFDNVSLSISSNFNKKDNLGDAEAAQLFHFDLERPKWLKFLIYINDINLNNGPHCYVKKTHLNNGIPFGIRSRGYVRLNDQELKKFNLESSVLTAKAGTAIIEDTRGLHKGEKLVSGYRILLNIQMNNSLFGAPIRNFKFNKIELQELILFSRLKNVFSDNTNIKNYLNNL
jgi:hypothetical protein